MKAAVAALLIIAAIIAAITWNAVMTHSFLDEFTAAESITDKRSLWDENRLRLRLTVHRKSLYNIETSLDQMEAYADSPDAPEFTAAKSALELALESIRTLESISGAP